MLVLDYVFLLFFIIHVPITWLIDAQGVIIPREVYPEFLQNLTLWYIKSFDDVLMANPPIWFQSFVFFELIFQFPLLLLNIYGLIKSEFYLKIESVI